MTSPHLSLWPVPAPALRRTLAVLATSALVVTLGACSTTRVVEGQVRSFSTLTATLAPATYRLDRLPSQQGAEFADIATLAEQALTRAGLQRDDQKPRLLVQITTEAGSVPRYDPYSPYGPFGPYGMGGRGWAISGFYGGSVGIGGIWRMGGPTPLHHRAVRIVMRDLQTQQVVYETSAVHDDVWVQDPAVYGLLFDAALNGFPQPPTGPREVRLPLPPAP